MINENTRGPNIFILCIYINSLFNMLLLFVNKYKYQYKFKFIIFYNHILNLENENISIYRN